jgi:hypothetical protein
MKSFKNIFSSLLVLMVFGICNGSAQINVFEQNCLELSQSEYDNTQGDIESGCIETPNDGDEHIISPVKDRDIKAATFIRFRPGTNIKADNARTRAYIEESPFQVVAFVNNMSAVPRLSKLELGILPPEDVMIQIENYFSEIGTNELNPYLSNQLRIYAEFYYAEQLPPFLPAAPQVTRDAFYYKEVERDISAFDALYDHPSINTPNHVNGVDANDLGGSWTVNESEYPFRIRFAPEYEGKWEGKIKIEVAETLVYETPNFQFTVTQSNNKGYVEVGNTKRYLTRDENTHFPNGMNFPFISRYGYPLLEQSNGNKIIIDPQYSSNTPPIGFYEQGLRYMDTLAMNGVNHIRFIMAPHCSDIEWEKLGDYTNRQHIAREMDLIIEKAEEHDILINWNLSLHFRFCVNLFGNKFWDWDIGNAGSADLGDPYNRELNLSGVEDFFTDENAKFYWEERLRYTIARWGYSPQIAMFELLSEIDQVGKEMDEDQLILEDPVYPTNPSLYANWQKEMASYLKNDLGLRNLLTASYTIGIKEEIDDTYTSPAIDVASINNYNYYIANVHGFHRNVMGTYLSNEGFNDNEQDHWLSKYNKPIFFSESGAHELWECDNHIETRRNIWQNAFWGVSGTLDWEIEQLYKHPNGSTDVWSIYQRVAAFFDGVDLDGENWHAGMTELKNDGSLEYNKSYRDDCIRNDELADVVYLRSGNKEKAFGVITNRRANYFTLGEGECVDKSITSAPLHSDSIPQYNFALQNYGSVSPESGDKRLRIRNMKLAKEYKIKYYSPYDVVNSIKEETRWGPKLTLEFPNMDTLAVVLFEVFRMGSSFKNIETDTTEIKKSTQTKIEQETEKITVYPNPNNGNFVVTVENSEKLEAIHIYDNLGKKVHSRHEVQGENYYSGVNFKSGIYFVEVIYRDNVLRKKIVIN